MTCGVVIDFNWDVDVKNEIKELAVVDVDGWRMQSFHLRSSNNKKIDGHVPYSELQRILYETTDQATTIFAYDQEKCDFLEKLLDRTVVNMKRSYECPPPNEMSFITNTCMSLRHITKDCAMRNAQKLALWVKANHLSIFSKV